ncbi:MAG TPA: putative inorganic carbon transporter subunit DabA, partial [Gemmatimonadales bacterium]|nr:putative inorganic carbon transporter subunit DabA [Gemmatimonadales bacterium]
MSAMLEMVPDNVTPAELAPVIDAACGRIAPAWPLDRMIAVNPYWGFVDRPIEAAAAELSALSGTRLLMPHAWYRAQWEAGRFTGHHVAEALTRLGSRRPAEEVLAALRAEPPVTPVRRLITDLVDADRDLAHHMSWGEFVTRHLSQAAAARFDEGQARWTPERSGGLYEVWRSLALRDGGPRLLMGLRGFREAVAELPADPEEMIALATDMLAVPPAAREGWFTALLMTVHGWASACAFRRWEARLAGGDDDEIVHLLAARLAWEVILYRLSERPGIAARWSDARRDWSGTVPAARFAERDDWVCQRALELAYQEKLLAGLARHGAGPVAPPAVQAVFCIDVRSEVFRRALEAEGPEIQTLGFAGFFGLPVAYRPPVGPARPQLPGLLAPGLTVEDATGSEALTARWRHALERKAAWKHFATTAGSAFSFVEIAGLAYGFALLRDTLADERREDDPLRTVLGRETAQGLRPEIAGRRDGSPLEPDGRVALAEGILRAMSLTHGFARLVALIGHGAGVTNNPQAAGLHCGACGGQTGEVNARALAALLNDPGVRSGLATRGIDLPPSTWFVAGLHDTTTDDITLYDLDRMPATHQPGLAGFQRHLIGAGQRARAERAGTLGLAGLTGDALDRAVRRRAADWSEVRPEWGLARNAAFVVAPREHT